MRRDGKLIERLYAKQAGRCWWCDEIMIAPGFFKLKDGEKTPPRFCTREHLEHRSFHASGPAARTVVAACYECNTMWGAALHKEHQLRVKMGLPA